MPQLNQTAVCHKLYAVKMVSQNYQIFLRSDFANKNTLLIRSYQFIYYFCKEKMEKMDKTVRFSIILVCYFIMKSFSFVSLALTNSICFPHRKRWS